jgi:hypothetical protein
VGEKGLGLVDPIQRWDLIDDYGFTLTCFKSLC